MKMLRYLFINILIILAPIYGNWDLISNGERCQGTVFEIKEIQQQFFFETYPQISYKVGGKTYKIQGPENSDYPLGSKMELIYAKDKPSEAIIYTVSGFLSQWYTIMAFVLLIMWNAFYLSFINGKPKYNNSRTSKSQLPK
jgi:hypothetical protein